MTQCSMVRISRSRPSGGYTIELTCRVLEEEGIEDA